MLDAVLGQCEARGFLKARGRQRTDATHVLGVLRVLNRLELVSETLRAALNAVALAEPEWLRAWAPREWFERYGRRIEESRLPQGKEDRRRYAALVGADGMQLLERAYAPVTPAALRSLAAVEAQRQVWIAQYVVHEGQIQLRDPKDMPLAEVEIETPYEVEARFGEKRGHRWIGYKVHLAETCEEASPHLVLRWRPPSRPPPMSSNSPPSSGGSRATTCSRPSIWWTAATCAGATSCAAARTTASISSARSRRTTAGKPKRGRASPWPTSRWTGRLRWSPAPKAARARAGRRAGRPATAP